MTIDGDAVTYHALYTASDPPSPDPIRERRQDWQQLTDTEQLYVRRYLDDELALSAVPTRAREFIRRHHGGR